MRDSFAKNKKGILIMLCSALCACVGQLLWKLSATEGILLALLGFVLYGFGALFMLIAYKYGSLSVLQPMQSVSYILSIIIGVMILNESLNLQKVIGVIVIMMGMLLIGGGDTEA